MKSLMMLWKSIAEDSAIRCRTSATMDWNTVQVRVKHEGFSFMTITLPDYCNDFQKSLSDGLVSPNSFLSFKKRGDLPLFLGGFLEKVFTRDGGVLLEDPDIDAILAIRQLTLLFSKISIPCSDARYRKAIKGYLKSEQEIREFDVSFHLDFQDKFERLSRILYSGIFSKMDKLVYDGDIVPKHGPGATADRLMGNRKYDQRTWPNRLEEIFPAGEFLFPSWSHYYEHMDSVEFLEPGDEIPVKVISVPKTQKSPRIIAMEPTAMQYAQQGILEIFLDCLEDDKLLFSMLGFEDQKPNQQMAYEGSLSGELATLDLSEASDRVSNQHVRSLMPHWPHLHKAVEACRSRKADVPGEGVVRLSKFASMGSALCFPFEAMTFLVIVLMGIEEQLNTPLERGDIKRLLGQVRIYGDDIIIPVDFVHSVIDMLHAFGHRVSLHKSFWNGKFRESCGKEYYAGFDVSVVKVRNVFPSSLKDATEVISTVSLRNQLYFAGYWNTVRDLDQQIERVLRRFPYVDPDSSVLGRHSFLGYQIDRIGEDMHNPLVKGYVVSPRIPRNALGDAGALLKFFLKRGGQPSVDRKHLERSGRPRAVDIKPRWASPF